MPRITLFAKGNVDVHDALHSCRIGGQLLWNGVNEVLRVHHPEVTARVQHETWARSDALLAATGEVPLEVAARDLPLGSYPARSQYSRALFEANPDAIVLSIQPDLMSGMMRHRRDGYLLYPAEMGGWSPEDRRWLSEEFEALDHLDAEASMANLAAIVDRVRERSDAPILILNVSSVVPGETLHAYVGLDETMSTRIRRFNLGLVELSERTGVSIIDVDALIARHGADALKLDTLHLRPLGYELIAREVVRVLEDLGVFEEIAQ